MVSRCTLFFFFFANGFRNLTFLVRQSHLWPQSLSYPLKPNNSDECYTSSMIPVSHLAREGLVPITMGMVLCNEPADRIDPYVKMVHGLHAEGVVR